MVPVLESVAHTGSRKPGEQEAALFPCKDIRMRPQLPCDLPIYQGAQADREDMRRAGVQLLHCGARLLPCSVNCPHCLTLTSFEPEPLGAHLNGSGVHVTHMGPIRIDPFLQDLNLGGCELEMEQPAERPII